MEIYKYYVYLHSLLQKVLSIVKVFNAGVVELVDTLDLGSSAARCESSSLSARTAKQKPDQLIWFFYLKSEEIFFWDRINYSLF